MKPYSCKRLFLLNTQETFLLCVFSFGFTLKVSCDSGWTLSTQSGSCVKLFSGSLKTWKEARQSCAKDGSDLVKIRDSSMNKFVSSEMLQSKSLVYIGLHKNVNTNVFRWLDESTEVNFYETNLQSLNEPREMCGVMNLAPPNGHSWDIKPCNEKYAYMCEKFPVQLCPDGLFANPYSGTCIKVFYVKESWDKARAKCQDKGGDLAIIENDNVNDFLIDQTDSKSTHMQLDSFWIGLNDRVKQNDFKWLDNIEKVKFTHLKNQQSTGRRKAHCGVINTILWSAVDCNSKMFFICEHFADCKHNGSGMTCLTECTHCEEIDEGGACNERTDICYKGCTNQMYGVSCSKQCSPNCGGPVRACNRLNGSCLSGCAPGYKGDKCDKAAPRDRGHIYSDVAIYATVVFSVAIVFCAILVELCVPKKKDDFKGNSEVDHLSYHTEDDDRRAFDDDIGDTTVQLKDNGSIKSEDINLIQDNNKPVQENGNLEVENENQPTSTSIK